MWMMLQWMHAALIADQARAWPQVQKLESNHSPKSVATKVEKEIAIVNRPGLHARPAARFSRAANRFRLRRQAVFGCRRAIHDSARSSSQST
jgi:hypothetical protein